MQTSDSVVEIVKLPANELMDGEPERYQECLKMLSEQPGLKNQWYSGAIEDPNLYHGFLEWNTYEDHLKFIDSPVYHPFGAKLKALLADEWDFHHVALTPAPTANAFKGPIVSYRTLTLKPDVNQTDAAKVLEEVVAATSSFEKCNGAAWGFWKEDERRATIIASWISKEAYKDDFSQSDSFKTVGSAFARVAADTHVLHMNIKHYDP